MQFAALLAVLSLATRVWPQSPVSVTIDPSGEHFRVYLSYLDTTAQENFVDVFRTPMSLEWKPYSLLLTNVSGKAIVAVNIRWMAISAGEIGFYDSSIDSILPGMPGGAGSLMRLKLPGQKQSTQTPVPIGASNAMAQGAQVAANGERMLVAPGLFVRESARRSSGGSGMPETIKTAETVSAILDVVILEDGEVLGPDASHTVDSLRTRKASINAVLQAVRAAEQNGQDGVEALRQLANPPRGPENGKESVQLRTFVRSLMTSPDWEERLEKLSAIHLPNFYR
jgi:hypothetical protein